MLVYIPSKGDMCLMELDGDDENDRMIIKHITSGKITMAQMSNLIRQILPADAFTRDLRRYELEVKRNRPIHLTH